MLPVSFISCSTLGQLPCFSLKKKKIEVELIYNILLVSVTQQNISDIYALYF